MVFGSDTSVKTLKIAFANVSHVRKLLRSHCEVIIIVRWKEMPHYSISVDFSPSLHDAK